MSPAPTRGARSLLLRAAVERASAALTALALFAIMALTLFDVSGRKLVSQSIPGSLELTEMLMVAVIFAALPLVSLRDEHVVFDSLDARLPRPLLSAQRLVVHLLCMLCLLGLGWLMWQTGAQFAASGETSAQLKIPRYPFIYGMGVLCAVTGLVHGLLAWDVALHGADPHRKGEAAAEAPRG